MVGELLTRHPFPGLEEALRMEGRILSLGHRDNPVEEGSRHRYLVTGALVVGSPLLALWAAHPEPSRGDLSPERYPSIERSLDPAEQPLRRRRNMVIEPTAQQGRLLCGLRRAPPDLLHRLVEEEEVVAVARPLAELVEEPQGPPGLAHQPGHPRVDLPALLPVFGQRQHLAQGVVPQVLGGGEGTQAEGAVLRDQGAYQPVAGGDLADQEGERLRPAALVLFLGDRPGTGQEGRL